MKLTTTAALSVLAIASAVALAGCSQPAASSPTGSSAAGKKLDVIVGNMSDAYYRSLQCGAKVAGKELGVTVDLQGPKAFDTTQQVPIVNAATAQDPSGIIIAPTDETALFPPLKQAKDKGIEILTVDTTLKDDSILTSSLSADWGQMGTLAAQQIVKAVGGKGTVLAIFSPPGVTTNDLGRAAFTAEMKKHPGVTADIQYSQGEAGKSASITAAALARYPSLAGVLTFNGGDAEGAVTALTEADKSGKVKFVTGGARDYQIDLLRKGTASALLVPAPYKIGYEAVKTAVSALDGKKVEKEISTPIVVATKANMDDPAISSSFYKPCD
ncbi:ABC transporter substrate-binding protein [Leifsonia sp. LS-T14]|uniref:ABC transporter substrate-binding protein n=1 Tax=unclassified Leifsonia TaxID=2663824 RepID=UPI0035A6B140